MQPTTAGRHAEAPCRHNDAPTPIMLLTETRSCKPLELAECHCRAARAKGPAMRPRMLLLALVAAAPHHVAAQVTDCAVVVRTNKDLRRALEITSVNRIFVTAGLTSLDANWRR